ncbi:MAG: MATE family efflux transporter [Defluviitaleaceae bacterium]|nr:MATE family efflux transporter [Defluviitaleaceae bacterium]
MFNISSESKIFYKKLFSLATPVITSELLAALVNILDTIMITRGMSIYHVNGAALANRIFFIYVVIFWGAVSACGVFIGQYYGKGDTKNIQKTVGLGLTFSIFTAIAFFIPSFFFPRQMIRIFSLDEPTIELGAMFLRTLSFSYFFVAITFTRNGCMRNTGQTKLPMVTTSVALILNFIFNYIFIFLFNAPLSVVAFGTVIARFVEMCLQHYFIKKYNVPVDGTIKKYLSYDRKFVKEVFKVGIFIILSTSIWSIGTGIYDIAYGRIGPYAQGAVKISTSLMQLFQVFGISLGVATQIIMTNTLGSGDRELSIRYARKCLKSAVSISSVMAILLIIFAPYIVGIFNADENVTHYVLVLTYIYSGGLILRTGNFVALNGILRSGGDTKFHFYLDLVAVWFIGIPLAFLGAVYFELPIYLVVLIVHSDEMFKFIIGFIRVSSNKWANKIV